MLERGDALGPTALSSIVLAAPTRFQRRRFSGTMARTFKEKITAGGAGLVRAICSASGPAIEWLADAHAIPFQLVEGFLYPGHSVERMHSVPEKTGAALMFYLSKAVSKKGVDVLTSARVTHVAEKSVKFERPDGSEESVEYDALVLACSGFGGNAAMVHAHIPEAADALYFGHAGNQGDAVRWGTKLGAAIRDMSGYQGHGSVATPQNILITWALMTEGGIQVNADGQRFSNEHVGYSEQCVPVLQQPGGVAWCIYDERLHQLGMTFPDYRDAQDAGAVKMYPPLPRLEETLEKVRRYASGGQDPFGRDFSKKPTLVPPYYGIKVTGALFHTQGGLVVDQQARSPDSTGRPHPTLCRRRRRLRHFRSARLGLPLGQWPA